MKSPTPAMPAGQQPDTEPTALSYDLTTRDSVVSPAQDKASRTVTAHRCEALMRDGQRCTRDVATVFQDGGWKCPSHRPRAPKDAKPVKLPRPPVGAPKDPAEALQLVAWTVGQAALGRITKQHADAIRATCAEFRIAWAANDETAALLRRNEALGRYILKLVDEDPLNIAQNLAKLRALFDEDADTPEPQPVTLARGPDGLLPDEDDTP